MFVVAMLLVMGGVGSFSTAYTHTLIAYDHITPK